MSGNFHVPSGRQRDTSQELDGEPTAAELLEGTHQFCNVGFVDVHEQELVVTEVPLPSEVMPTPCSQVSSATSGSSLSLDATREDQATPSF